MTEVQDLSVQDLSVQDPAVQDLLRPDRAWPQEPERGAARTGVLDLRSGPGAGPLEVGAVQLELEVTDPRTGVVLRRVRVGDESDGSPTKVRCQADFAARDAVLRDNPSWPAPRVVHGDLVSEQAVSDWMFSSAAMREWRTQLVPSARALYPMQRPFDPRLSSGGPVDPAAASIFLDCLDAIGIRTRARIMKAVVLGTVCELPPAPPGQAHSWVSLACGAALPVLDAVLEVGARKAHLSLVDLDPQALDFAGRLAQDVGLVPGRDFTLLQRDLVTSVVARTALLDELGEGSAVVVDALGIFEYFRDASCVRLLRNAYRLLQPGGVLVVANMLSDRRELAINQRGVGWPLLHPRSVEDLVTLVARAGLPLERTTITVPQDGVYAVVHVTR